MFMEAGCLEWCVVIGLILRDVNVIKQVIGFLDSPEVPPETVQSVRGGLLAVDAWVSADWWVELRMLRCVCVRCLRLRWQIEFIFGLFFCPSVCTSFTKHIYIFIYIYAEKESL